MSNKITLQVDVIQKIKERIDQTKQSYERIGRSGAFEKRGGEEASTRIKGSFAIIDELLKKTELTETEFGNLAKAIQTVFASLTNFATKMGKTSNEIQKIQQSLSDIQEKRGRAEESLTLSKTVKTDAYAALADEMAKKGLFKINKEGQLSKIAIKKPETLERLYRSDKSSDAVGYKDASGNIVNIKHDDDIRQAIQNYNEASQAVSKWEDNIVALEESLLDLQKRLEKIAEKVKDPGVQEILELTKIETAMKDTIFGAKRSHDDYVAAERAAESNEKLNQTHKDNEKSLTKVLIKNTLYRYALRLIRKAISDAIGTIKELDSSLTEQAMVIGKTRKEAYVLLETYQKMAIELGTVSKEVAEVMTAFVRQGKSITDSLKLTEAAISAARVAGISARESVDYLTTALNGFQLSAEKAMEVSDKFAAIAARAATDYNEIATALSKVAAQAHLAGISIDQTTALLATGIEVTREAPETIGTALKTIVARMREMSDYGKTLDGESDINNVETQLAFVGIQLRNVNGELRSTGEVFDDLGAKWKELDINQQAAIARALAGTRQQARLIAMMSNYERVMELQQIAEESAGTTVAQMGTYLQGLDAAMNRLNTTWEKIVTTISDSDVIIGIVDLFTQGLDLINDILSSSFGMVAVLTTIGLIGVGILARKKVEWEMQKAMLHSKLKEEKIEMQIRKSAKEKLREEQKITLEKAKQARANAFSMLSKAKEKGTAEEIAQAELLYSQTVSQVKEAKAALALTDAEILDINAEMNQNSLQQLQHTQGISSILSGLLAPVLVLMNIWRMITVAIKAANAATAANATATEKVTAKTKLKAMWEMVASASAKPIVGWIIGAAILAAFGIAAAIGIAKYKQAMYEKSAEGTAKAVNDLSKEIFDLNRRVEGLNKGLETFRELDGQIIKTKEDIEAMNKALDEAADKLSTRKEENLIEGLGISEKEYYDSLQTQKSRLEFLASAQDAMEKAMTEKREETLKRINKMSKEELNKFLTEPEYLSARDAIYALNNKTAYEYISVLEERNKVTKDAASASKTLIKNILEEVDAFEAWNKANNIEEIEELIDMITSLSTSVEGENISVAEILGSDDYSLKSRVEAFKELTDAFEHNKVILESIQENYSQYQTFKELSDDTLDFTEKLGLTNQKLNDLYKGYKALHQIGIDITQEEYQSRFFNYLEKLTELQGDVAATTETIFGDMLSSAENYEKTWTVLINNLTNLISVGTLNMGQNIDKFSGKVNSFYSTAIKWREMSETDRTKFMDENKELFAGKSVGDELLRAFQSGNFTMIEQALASNPTLMKERERLLGQITQELKNELAREGDAYNAAYVEFLKQQKAYFEDSNKIYRPSLEERLKQEEAAIERYKDLLEKQQEALVRSLEKKKDAYQKYFDAINEQAEDEEYEEQASKIIENISKLSATSNADASKMRKELSQELQQLEKERLKTLRERAQEQVIQNIEEELKKIQDKFDELIKSNKDLLDAFLERVRNPETLLAEKISQTAISDGLTKTGFESFLVELRNDWGAFLDTVKWDELSVNRGENAGGNLILNIAGEEINLSSEDSKVFADAISEALRQTGYR